MPGRQARADPEHRIYVSGRAKSHVSNLLPPESSFPDRVSRRLEELGIELPNPGLPGANYVPFIRTGDLLYITGQLSQWNGERRFIGKLGREFAVSDGQQAARLSALNVLAQARAALGTLDHIRQCVRLVGYVNSMPDFLNQSQVMNGASDLLVDVLGDAGRHTRVAVGVNVLPYDVATEVECIFEIASVPDHP